MTDKDKRPECGHSACVQNWIDTGQGICVAPIVCPECQTDPPRLNYKELPTSYQRVDIGEGGSISLDEPSYEHNDAGDPQLVCRDCSHAWTPPKAFYDADPWG